MLNPALAFYSLMEMLAIGANQQFILYRNIDNQKFNQD